MTKIKLNPIEQKYIGTCYPLPDRIGLELCNIWKNKLKTNYKNEDIKINLNELKIAFPFIYNFLTTNKSGSIQNRFEGISEDSHLKKLYIKAENIKIKIEILEKNLEGKKAYLKLLEHYEGCGIKVADLERNIVLGYGGDYNVKIDKNYFEEITGRYVIIHGKSQNGLIVIRTITKSEFDLYAKILKDIQNRTNNPFKKFKKNLEEMLNSNS